MTADPAAATGPRYSWLGVVWPEPVRVVLALQCAAACVLQLYIGYQNARLYSVDVVGAFTVLFWFVSGLFSGVAAIAVSRRRPWFPAPLLIAETMIALSALYVLWADLSSAYPDAAMLAPAAAMLLVACLVIPPLALRLSQLPGKAWAGSLALLSGLGIAQFTLENYVMPNRSAPRIEISTDLEQVGHSGGVTHVRGMISLKNVGRATAWLPQAFASVQAVGATQAAAPLEPAAVMETFNPLSTDLRPFVRPLPPEADSGIIWLEDLARYTSTLVPGVSDRREFVVDVPRDRVRTLELRVDLTALTNARGASATTCEHDESVDVSHSDFLDRFRVPQVVDEWTYSCMDITLRDRNFIRAHTDDRRSVQMGYLFTTPDSSAPGPYTYYVSDDTDPTIVPTSEVLQRETERFDRLNPSVVMVSIDALALPTG